VTHLEENTMTAKTLTLLIAGLSLVPLAACQKEKETTTRITEASPPPAVVVTPPPEKAETPPPASITINPPAPATEPPPAKTEEAPKTTQ